MDFLGPLVSFLQTPRLVANSFIAPRSLVAFAFADDKTWGDKYPSTAFLLIFSYASVHLVMMYVALRGNFRFTFQEFLIKAIWFDGDPRIWIMTTTLVCVPVIVLSGLNLFAMSGEWSRSAILISIRRAALVCFSFFVVFLGWGWLYVLGIINWSGDFGAKSYLGQIATIGYVVLLGWAMISFTIVLVWGPVASFRDRNRVQRERR